MPGMLPGHHLRRHACSGIELEARCRVQRPIQGAHRGTPHLGSVDGFAEDSADEGQLDRALSALVCNLRDNLQCATDVCWRDLSMCDHPHALGASRNDSNPMRL